MPILCYLLLLYPDFSLNLFFVDTDLSWYMFMKSEIYTLYIEMNII